MTKLTSRSSAKTFLAYLDGLKVQPLVNVGEDRDIDFRAEALFTPHQMMKTGDPVDCVRGKPYFEEWVPVERESETFYVIRNHYDELVVAEDFWTKAPRENGYLVSSYFDSAVGYTVIYIPSTDMLAIGCESQSVAEWEEMLVDTSSWISQEFSGHRWSRTLIEWCKEKRAAYLAQKERTGRKAAKKTVKKAVKKPNKSGTKLAKKTSRGR
jgi:hypothetical protein